MQMLTAGTLVFAGVFGVWAGRAIGHGGHVEIAPTALAHARSHAPARAKRSERPRATRAVHELTTSEHALLHGVHDPKQLVARAKTLASLGLDVTVVDVPMSDAFSTEQGFGNRFWPTWKLVYDAQHALAALEVAEMPRASPLRVAGLTDGDRVESIDGWRFQEDEIDKLDPNAVRKRGWVVVELERGGHHVVLSIRWGEKR
ncbi:MAG TPA: hypothetical protein VGH28_15330 [Polyangiaceae bacterium]|jgi:hypothetical protein